MAINKQVHRRPPAPHVDVIRERRRICNACSKGIPCETKDGPVSPPKNCFCGFTNSNIVLITQTASAKCPIDEWLPVETTRPRTAPSHKTDCTHRPKERIRQELCMSCSGHRMANVYQCPIHGECTPFKGKKPFENIKYCGDCPDRTEDK